MPWHVKRTRIVARPDSSMLGTRDTVGDVRYSKTHVTEQGAQLDADSWVETGRWRAEVVYGRSPNDTRNSRRS